MVQDLNDGSVPDGTERIRRRAESRRLEILRAAARVFRRQGYASTGMREIAAEAELSPGNLYHYFAGKHEILFFCQDRALDRMLASLEQARLSGASHTAQLHEVLLAHVCCLLDDLEGSVAHLEVDELPAELRGQIVAKRDRYEGGLRKLVAAGVRSKEFSRCDADLVTRAMLGALNWSARWFRPDGTKTAAAVAESMADYLIRGLAAERTGPACTDDTGGTR